MFAQFLGAAKRAISRTPSYQGRSSQAGDEIPEIPTSDPAAPIEEADTAADNDDIMVTTRRGTETPGMASTPASSSKKKIGKRELEALDTPTQTKRQKKTTVEVTRNLRSTPRKGAPVTSTKSSQESVDEAVSDSGDATTKPETTSPLAIRRRSSPKVMVEPSSPAKEDGPDFHTPEPASSEAAFVTPFTSKKALAGSPTPKATKTDTDTPAAAKKARGRPKKAQKEEIPDEIPSSTQESSIASPTAEPPKAHVRFGSEEPSVNAKGHTRYEAPQPAPKPNDDEDDDDDDDSADDSDEAPEMVSTSAAASAAAAAHADTTRAVTAQAEKERKKREARELRIASEEAAKRERDALKALKQAARAAKAARLSSVAESHNSEHDEAEQATPHTQPSTLPSLLPTSLLNTLDDVRPPTPPPEEKQGISAEQQRREKLNRHIKFLEHSSKAPKDRRVGKHHVAVLGGAGERILPPKVSAGGRGVREAWLKGRGKGTQQGKGRGKVGKKGQRAKFGGGGFLRGED